MAAGQLALKKLVAEWRYKPDLGFYEKMDAVGLAYVHELSDWQRTPLTLDVRNKKKHRRLFLSHRRSFLESDGPANLKSEVDFATDVVSTVSQKLAIRSYHRLGLRLWFVSDAGKSFPALVDDVYRKLYGQNRDLAALVGERVKDVAYVVDLEHGDGWKYNVRLGPMERTQWFEAVQHEPEIFEDDEGEGGETFRKFRASIPEQFLYVDLDYYRLELDAADGPGFLRTASGHAQDLAQRLIHYCQG